jgi:hypothetical protein
MSEKTKSEPIKTLGDLKVFYLSQAVKSLLEVRFLLNLDEPDQALKVLANTLPILPSDIQEETKDIPATITKLRMKQHSLSSNLPYPLIEDSYAKVERQIEFAATFIPFIRESLVRLFNLITKRYLQEGYSGTDLNLDGAQTESYEPGDKNEDNVD